MFKAIFATLVLVSGLNAFGDVSAVSNWMQAFAAAHGPVLKGKLEFAGQIRAAAECELGVYADNGYLSLCARNYPLDPNENCIGTFVNPSSSLWGRYQALLMEVSSNSVEVRVTQDEGGLPGDAYLKIERDTTGAVVKATAESTVFPSITCVF